MLHRKLIVLFFRFCFAHLNVNCRRKLILEYFEEPCSSEVTEVMGQCCDVCSLTSDTEVVDCQREISAIVQTVEEIPNVGEKKVSV